MESVSTPRVSGTLIDRYVGKNVMVIGKVLQLRGNEATVGSDGSVTLFLNPEAHLTAGNAAQIIGKVNPDLSVKCMSAIDLGNNVDFTVNQAVVNVTHQHKELFIYE